MKRLTSIILISIAVAAAWVLPQGRASASDSFGYEILDYRVDVQVDADNTYHIREIIQTDFLEERHGIFRFIPFRTPERPSLYSRLENLETNVEKEVTVTTENGYRFLDIRLGDPDRVITGAMTYELRYDLEIGRFPGEQFIGVNLMGNMGVPIQQGSFLIRLPKPVAEEEIAFYQGSMGSSSQGQVAYTYEEDGEGGLIRGTLSAPVGGNEFLTLYIPVSDEYFAGAPVLLSLYESSLPWIAGAMLLALAGGFFLWFRFGRDRRIVSVLEFFPPEGLTPLEIGALYREEALNTVTPDKLKEATSLIYWLANQGVVKIHFQDKEEFYLEQAGEISPQAPLHVRNFFSALFQDGKVIGKKELEKRFYDIGSAAILTLPARPVAEGRSVFLKILGILLSLLPYVLIYPGLFDQFTDFRPFIAGVVSLLSLGLVILFSTLAEKGVSGIQRRARGFLLPLLLVIAGGALAVHAIVGLWAVTFLFLAAAGGMTLSSFIRRRKDSQVMLLGRISGFRQFLLTAKKNELEKLVGDHPYYFYDCLPYAHVLGVSQAFAEKFQGMKVQLPPGYAPEVPAFTYWYLFHQLNTMNHIVDSSYMSHIQASRSAFSGGSSFGGGGGGFSGGGFGGGGGGSW